MWTYYVNHSWVISSPAAKQTLQIAPGFKYMASGRDVKMVWSATDCVMSSTGKASAYKKWTHGSVWNGGAHRSHIWWYIQICTVIFNFINIPWAFFVVYPISNKATWSSQPRNLLVSTSMGIIRGQIHRELFFFEFHTPDFRFSARIGSRIPKEKTSNNIK